MHVIINTGKDKFTVPMRAEQVVNLAKFSFCLVNMRYCHCYAIHTHDHLNNTKFVVLGIHRVNTTQFSSHFPKTVLLAKDVPLHRVIFVLKKLCHG